MTGAELSLIAAIVAGFGFLFARDSYRRHRQLDVSRRYGLVPGQSGLAHMPDCLRSTVLFLVADGGHERGVLRGSLDLSTGHSSPDAPLAEATWTVVPMTVFDFAFQRDVRGEWGYLDSQPRFRIFSPVTVVAFELPVRVPHLLIKRRGAAEVIAEDGLERYRSVVNMVRDVSTIDRGMAVPPPPTLPRLSVDLGKLSADYLIWAEQPDSARLLMTDDLTAHLRTPAVSAREIVIELLGPLMLMYCATDGILSDADGRSFVALCRELCRRICANMRAAMEDAEL